MQLGVDTCTWLKLFHFEEVFPGLVEKTISSFNVFITHDVFVECLFHCRDKEEFFKAIEVKPRLNKTINHYFTLGFDSADASLLEYADHNSFSEEGSYVVITEDPEMLALNVWGTTRVIQLVDWVKRLYQVGLFSKQELRFVVTQLHKTRNITKRKQTEVLRR